MPRLFITWYAEPEDPRYWEYFPVEGIVVSLKSVLSIPRWKLSRVLLDGFKRYFDFRGTLIVDSFTTWLHTRAGFSADLPQYHVLYLQHLLGSDLLVQKDYPFIGDMDREGRERMFKKNLVNAEAALKIGERLGREVMLVVQGWDVNSYVKCAKFYRRLGAKYVGIGSLVPRSNDVEFVERVVKEVRAVLGRSVWLHLFGVANIDVLRRVAKYVDSVDVSTPTLAATKKEMIVWEGGRFVRLKTTSLTNISSFGQLIEETGDVFERELLTKILDAKTISEKNKLLMIYNTYVFQKHVNELL